MAGLEKPGVEIIRDRAEIIDPHTVRTVKGGRTLSTRYILVATGADSSDTAECDAFIRQPLVGIVGP